MQEASSTSRIVHAHSERFQESVADAAEPWESPVGPEAVAGGGQGLAEHPYVPLRWEEVPKGASTALADTCGAWRLDQLFVIPAGARRIPGHSAQRVATPAQVLGLADRGVALWVDTGPAPGVQLAIGLDELVAIDHVQFLLYARVAFLARERRLTVRYNAVARHTPDRQVARLRAAAAGYPLPVPQESRPPLPRQWGHVAWSRVVCLRPDDSTVLRLGELSRPRRAPGGALLALTPGELVIVRDPHPDRLADAPAFGHDVLDVLRRRLERPVRMQDGVTLRGGGVELDVALPAPLADDLLALTEYAVGRG